MRAALSLVAPRAFGAICLLFVLNVSAFASPAGSVVGIMGGCVIESGGNRVAAKLSSTVQVGDTVEVPDGGRLRLRMADGSVLSIASGSRMTVTTYGMTEAGQRQDAQLMLQQGLVRAQVSQVKGTPARFEIDTAAGASAVRSTDFFVETQPGWVQTVVLSGSVTLTSAGSGAVTTLAPGQGARLETGREPAVVRVWQPAEIRALLLRTSFPQTNRPQNNRPQNNPPPRRRARSEGDRPSSQDDSAASQGNYSAPGPTYTPPAQPSYPPPGYSAPPYVPPPAYVPPPVYVPPPRYFPPPGGYNPPRGGYNPPPAGGGGNLPPRGGGDIPPRGGATPPPRGSAPPSSTSGSAGQIQ